LIDLHAHTTESDGTFSPAELVQEAVKIGLEALAITDHDTFAGFDQANPLADEAGLDLICGIELSTKMPVPGKPKGKSVHLLGYWFGRGPSEEFRQWLYGIQQSRRERNDALAVKLQGMGLDITIEEVIAMGRSMAGRPHFAALMVKKGYVKTNQEAFDLYLDESAQAYVDRHEPSFAEGVRNILDSGGLPSLAHPIRLGRKTPSFEEDTIRQMAKMGLPALEAYHSDHAGYDQERYERIARRFGLSISGGSDFHGAAKPEIQLGTGKNNNLRVGMKVLDRLRAGRR
jgi:hypothetical protein